MKLISLFLAALFVSTSHSLFILPVPLSVNDMREMWTGFLQGSGALADGDIQGVNETCLAENISGHLEQFAAEFSSFGAKTTIRELFTTLTLLNNAFEDFVSECHFSELNSHFTFHTFKYNLMEFLLHFAQEAENIEKIWGETVIHGGLRKYKEFGQGVGEIVALLINTRSAPHTHH